METIQLEDSKRLQVWSHDKGVTLQTEDADGRGSWQPAMAVTIPASAVAEVVAALQAIE